MGPRGSNGFSEEMYTTKVPELSEEKKREAERIAAEIEEESKQKQGRGGRELHRGGGGGGGAYGRRGPESTAGEYEDEDYADADAGEFISDDTGALNGSTGPPIAGSGQPVSTVLHGFPASGDLHHVHVAGAAGLPPPGAYGGTGAGAGVSTLPPSLLAAAQAQARLSTAVPPPAAETADGGDAGRDAGIVGGSDAQVNDEYALDEDDDEDGPPPLAPPAQDRPATASAPGADAAAASALPPSDGLLPAEVAAAFLAAPESLALLRYVSHEFQARPFCARDIFALASAARRIPRSSCIDRSAYHDSTP
jgi:hypothetical protein